MVTPGLGVGSFIRRGYGGSYKALMEQLGLSRPEDVLEDGADARRRRDQILDEIARQGGFRPKPPGPPEFGTATPRPIDPEGARRQVRTSLGLPPDTTIDGRPLPPMWPRDEWGRVVPGEVERTIPPVSLGAAIPLPSPQPTVRMYAPPPPPPKNLWENIMRQAMSSVYGLGRSQLEQGLARKQAAETVLQPVSRAFGTGKAATSASGLAIGRHLPPVADAPVGGLEAHRDRLASTRIPHTQALDGYDPKKIVGVYGATTPEALEALHMAQGIQAAFKQIFGSREDHGALQEEASKALFSRGAFTSPIETAKALQAVQEQRPESEQLISSIIADPFMWSPASIPAKSWLASKGARVALGLGGSELRGLPLAAHLGPSLSTRTGRLGRQALVRGLRGAELAVTPAAVTEQAMARAVGATLQAGGAGLSLAGRAGTWPVRAAYRKVLERPRGQLEALEQTMGGPATEELAQQTRQLGLFDAGDIQPPVSAMPDVAPVTDAGHILPTRVRDSILQVRQAVNEGVENYRTQGPQPDTVMGIPKREIPDDWRAGIDDLDDVQLEVAMGAETDRLVDLQNEMIKRGVKVPRDTDNFVKTEVYGEINAVQAVMTESGRRSRVLLYDAIARRHGGKSIADEFDILDDVIPSETGGRLDLNRLAADWDTMGQPEIGAQVTKDAMRVVEEADTLLYQQLGRPTTAAPTPVPAPVPTGPLSLGLPPELDAFKPGFKRIGKEYSPIFASHVDKALYIISRRGTQIGVEGRQISAAQKEQYMAWLRERLPTLSDEELKQAGDNVVNHVSRIAKDNPTRQAPGELQIPFSAEAGGLPPGMTPYSMPGKLTIPLNLISDKALKQRSRTKSIHADLYKAELRRRQLARARGEEGIPPERPSKIEEQVIRFDVQRSDYLEKQAENLTKNMAAVDSGKKAPPPSTLTPGGTNSDGALENVLNQASHDDLSHASMAQFEGARNEHMLEVQGFITEGNRILKEVGLTTLDDANVRPLINAVEARAPETLDPKLRPVYDALVAATELETKDMLQFSRFALEADMANLGIDAQLFMNRIALHPHYFPHIWKQPGQVLGIGMGKGRLGAQPHFAKLRWDASLDTMLDAGYDLATWNPFELLALRRMAGIEYRESVVMLNRLRRNGLAVPASEMPAKGWRVPQGVGPAFGGRPIVTPDGTTVIASAPWAVPNHVANFMEHFFAKVPHVDFLRDIRKWGDRAKRIKLFASYFQHADFFLRAVGVAFSPTGIWKKAPLKLPSLAKTLLHVNFSPGARNDLQKRLLSNAPIYKDFDITYRMLIQQGWGVHGDLSLLERGINTLISDPNISKGLSGRALQNGRKIQQFFETGLFDGVYRETQRWSLENFIIPWVRRTNPGANARQVAAQSAEIANIMFSTQGVWQTALKNPMLAQMTRTLMFSAHENEALLRGAFRALSRTHPSAGIFREWYLGMFLGLGTIANVINVSATGKILPWSSYNPIKINDPYASFYSKKLGGIGYNDRFLSPQLPWIKGRNGEPVYLDLVGQMDTIFRWAFNAPEALAGRYNVLPRAIRNQQLGTNFFGQELKTPINRLVQGVLDVGTPISAMSAVEILRQQTPALQDAIPETESTIGPIGLGLQAITGVNIRGSKTGSMLNRISEEIFKSEQFPEGVGYNELVEPYHKRIVRNDAAAATELARRTTTALGRKEKSTHAKRTKLENEQYAALEKLAEMPEDQFKQAVYNTLRTYQTLRSELFREIDYPDDEPDATNEADVILFAYYSIFEDPLIHDPETRVFNTLLYKNRLESLITNFPNAEAIIKRNQNLGPYPSKFIRLLKKWLPSEYDDINLSHQLRTRALIAMGKSELAEQDRLITMPDYVRTGITRVSQQAPGYSLPTPVIVPRQVTPSVGRPLALPVGR